jgi:hypothetical protein
MVLVPPPPPPTAKKMRNTTRKKFRRLAPTSAPMNSNDKSCDIASGLMGKVTNEVNKRVTGSVPATKP